ncbi:MAG: PAS domain-containing sensor histidine kinase [Cyanobacteria bacterium]|nr:PAS domain-containing sensor histidine kinase [Cyanobacteriota bacterium]
MTAEYLAFFNRHTRQPHRNLDDAGGSPTIPSPSPAPKPPRLSPHSPELRSRMVKGINASYRSIVENAIAGIFQTTPDGRYMSANRALARLYGYDSPAALVAALTNVGHQLYTNPGDRDTFVRIMAQEGSINGFESQVRRKDGTVLWIRESARSVYDDDGELLYYEGFVEDITEYKALEETLKATQDTLAERERELTSARAALLEAERLSTLGRMLAGIAHDLNNPVGFVRGNLDPVTQYAQDLLGLVQLYQQYLPEPPPEIAARIEDIELDFLGEDLPKVLDSMQVGLERIYRTVSALRAVSRSDDTQPQTVDLRETIDHTLTIVANRLKGRGRRADVQVTRSLDPLPPVTCYPGAIERALMNLLGNALDAMEEAAQGDRYTDGGGPQLTIATRAIAAPEAQGGAAMVQISVSDNGPGIPPEIQQKIFESFFTTKPPGVGTGLGLSIAKGAIVDRHGGRIWLDSEPGVGTTFHLEIPQDIAPRDRGDSKPYHDCLDCSP